jgi:hypothetical protein
MCLADQSMPIKVTCDTFPYGFKGAPLARPGLTAPAANNQDRR